MSWSDKAREVATVILEKQEYGILNNYTRNDVLSMMEICFVEGCRYECDIAVMPLLNKLNEDNE